MAKKYVVVDNHGNALGMYVCTVSEAETVKDVRLVALSEYVEFRRNALKGGKTR